MAHLRYIERDGTTREGGRGQAYGPESDSADIKAFEERGRGDRHQFRMIVSVEDADQLESLPRFTREFMKQLASDLETPLDWVAVDHWDTDNPHTHVVLRGRSPDGRDLVIAPDYMAYGMRMRASDIVTQWLGPRTELEVQESLRKEIAQERFTSLDRVLLACAADGIVCFDESLLARRDVAQLVGRTQRLERMGLAENVGAQRWRLAPDLQGVLRDMGERGDIMRAVSSALRGSTREVALTPDDLGVITGRLVGKGLSDELSDRAYVVLDGVDGRAHYVRMPAGTDLSEYPHESILQIDHRIRGHGRARLLCHLSIEEQVRATGPTWLDRQLVRRANLSDQGFGAIAKSALERRAKVLVERRIAEWRDAKLHAPNVIATLRSLEFEATVRELSARTGKPHLPDAKYGQVRGTIRQLQLASGRYAMLETDRSFSLVPWEQARKLEGVGISIQRNGLAR